MNVQLEFQSSALHACVHEIRGLLVAGNYARLLAQDRIGATTQPQKEYLELIIQNTGKIQEVLRSLSWIAEREGWKVELVSIGSLLSEVVELSEMRSLCSGVAAKDAPCIRADRDKLRDAFLILIDALNLKHSDCAVSDSAEGQVRITLTRRSTLLADGLQGKGTMSSPVNLQSRLEDVRHVLRLHGGSLFIESPPTGACEVTVTLPKADTRNEVACV